MFSVSATNFRSYEQLTYQVLGSGLVAVEGYWDGSHDKSNGAGKSSFLPDLLSWAIYGETVSGQRNVCRRGADICSVSVRFPFVAWTRTQKADGRSNKIDVEGADHRKLADSQEELAQYFPPKKVFTSTLILGQGVGERFSGWKPAERASVLADLFDLSAWGRARKSAAADAREFATKQVAAEVTIVSIQQSIAGLRSFVTNEKIDPAEAQQALACAQRKYASLAAAARSTEASFRGLEASMSGFSQELAVARAELSRLTADRKAAKTRKVCPTCGRNYTQKHVRTVLLEIDKKEKAALHRKTEAERSVAALEAEVAKAGRQSRSAADACLAANAEIQEANTRVSRARDFSGQIAELERQVTKKERELVTIRNECQLLSDLDKAFFEIPIRKIDNVLLVMNRYLVDICRTVWENEFLVQLVSERDLAKGGSRSEITMVVTNPAGDYVGSSWGQRRKIDLSVQLALRSMLLAAWPEAVPLLVCDDVADVLDAHSKQQLWTRFLLPESRKSAVFVLSPEAEHPVVLSDRVVIAYDGSRSRLAEITHGSGPVAIQKECMHSA